MNTIDTDISPIQECEGKPGTYTVPTLRPITNPVLFISETITDLDPLENPHICRECRNPDFECVCEVQA